jgi:hypothetical protein
MFVNRNPIRVCLNLLKSSLTPNPLQREGSIGLPLPFEREKGRLKIEMGHHIFPIFYQESRNNSHFQQF